MSSSYFWSLTFSLGRVNVIFESFGALVDFLKMTFQILKFCKVKFLCQFEIIPLSYMVYGKSLTLEVIYKESGHTVSNLTLSDLVRSSSRSYTLQTFISQKGIELVICYHWILIASNLWESSHNITFALE